MMLKEVLYNMITSYQQVKIQTDNGYIAGSPNLLVPNLSRDILDARIYRFQAQDNVLVLGVEKRSDKEGTPT